MAVSNDPEAKIEVETVPEQPAQQSVGSGIGGGGVTAGILRRWRKEELLKKGSLWLRGFALLFSLISFLLVASNKHGDWKDFDKYEEYRYLLAIAILSSLYSGGQVFRQVQEFSNHKKLIQPATAAFVDFFGDQIVAYLLISSASAAIPLTNSMRAGADNIFTDTSSAAISMSIFAFICLAISAIISGYKLSTQTHI